MSEAVSPLKVSATTHRLVRLAATMNECSMSALVDQAVSEFLASHADEIEAGLASARMTLLGEPADASREAGHGAREDAA